MNKIFVISMVFGMVLLNSVFASGRKEGNGNIVLVNRDVSLFDSIELSSRATVNIYQYDVEKITVEIDANLEKYIKTDLKAGTLEIDETWNVSLRPTKYIVNVYTPNIRKIKISGQGTIYFTDKLKTNDIELKISGSGKIEGILDSDTLTADISGAGDINISGMCKKATLGISGSGNIDSTDLEVETAKIEISGSGVAKVNVLNTLNGKISGSGNIFYKGTPKIGIDISGSGVVKAL